jgi:hypothetical protein
LGPRNSSLCLQRSSIGPLPEGAQSNPPLHPKILRTGQSLYVIHVSPVVLTSVA